MRYPYVALGLVFFLFACEAPTSPRITPSVDEGGGSRETNPTEDPFDCLKRRAPAPSANAQSGFEATQIPCSTDSDEDRGRIL
jgi:hypothetical protein